MELRRLRDAPWVVLYVPLKIQPNQGVSDSRLEALPSSAWMGTREYSNNSVVLRVSTPSALLV